MVLEMFSLKNRVAIVTGAGRGIGKRIAVGMAGVGADVVIASRTPAQLEETAAVVRATGRRVLAVPTDLQYSEQVDNLVKRTMAEFGRIDILVNNAGGDHHRPFLEMTEGSWDAMLRENMKSVFLGCQAVAKVMVQQRKGAIVVVSSVAGVLAQPGMAGYDAAKAGVIHLTRVMALELAPYNVRVNGIMPGFIGTEGMLAWIKAQSQRLPNFREKLERAIALGRWGDPDELVGAAIFLASDASAYITGENMAVAGGITTLAVI